MDYNQLPIGLGFAFAANRMAMDKFSDLSDDEKKEFIERSRSVLSKSELDKLVASLVEDEDDGPDLDDMTGLFNGPSIG